MMQNDERRGSHPSPYPLNRGGALPPGGTQSATMDNRRATQNSEFISAYNPGDMPMNSRGVSPALGVSGDLSSDVSHYNPEFMQRNTRLGTMNNLQLK